MPQHTARRQACSCKHNGQQQQRHVQDQAVAQRCVAPWSTEVPVEGRGGGRREGRGVCNTVGCKGGPQAHQLECHERLKACMSA